MRVFREPCYFAEAVYLLYYFVNEVSYEEEFARICKCYCRLAVTSLGVVGKLTRRRRE